nr:hypothetical protein [Tanacetum cinerariifolium]
MKVNIEKALNSFLKGEEEALSVVGCDI